MKLLSISTIIRLVLLIVVISLFFACSSSSGETQKDKWTIPEQYRDIPIEQIKSQIEITDYKTMKGAGTNAGTEEMEQTAGRHQSIVPGGGAVPKETPKNKADREALAQYINKLISLEGEFDQVDHNLKASPLDIRERKPGKYEMWFCTTTRKPCRYQALLLYSGPEGKGNTLFKLEDKIRFWGVMLGEEIKKLRSTGNIKRYPKIVVIDLEVIK